MTPSKRSVSELSLATLSPEDPIPLYRQIADDLRQMMATGKLSPLDILPPEKELSQSYGVGRQTMRMALAQLVQENLIARRAGSGTIILPSEDSSQFFLDRSFTAQIENMGMQATSEVLSSATGNLDEMATVPLRGYSGSPYFAVTRLRLADDVPISMQHTTILLDLCPDIADHDFSRISLYSTLQKSYGLIVNHITHAINATNADSWQAKLLHIARGDPLLQVKTSAYLVSGPLIEFTISHYRTDRYEYHISGERVPKSRTT